MGEVWGRFLKGFRVFFGCFGGWDVEGNNTNKCLNRQMNNEANDQVFWGESCSPRALREKTKSSKRKTGKIRKPRQNKTLAFLRVRDFLLHFCYVLLRVYYVLLLCLLRFCYVLGGFGQVLGRFRGGLGEVVGRFGDVLGEVFGRFLEGSNIDKHIHWKEKHKHK